MNKMVFLLGLFSVLLLTGCITFAILWLLLKDQVDSTPPPTPTVCPKPPPTICPTPPTPAVCPPPKVCPLPDPCPLQTICPAPKVCPVPDPKVFCPEAEKKIKNKYDSCFRQMLSTSNGCYVDVSSNTLNMVCAGQLFDRCINS